ncbi:MAG: YbhB/YbcL family Raf kinase inhibitor-like protein [Candidatus Theseobacter exili]|nr:YbhB/YbcL family Raf kinase inhibitor-like protein [Candidatus Theseobacter exili]
MICIRLFARSCFLLLFMCFITVNAETEEPSKGEKVMTISVQSSAFQEGQRIPERYTCKGANVSPPLSWSGVPEGTKCLVLICDDPDASVGTWAHWVVYGISAATTELPEGVPPRETFSGGAKHGLNDSRKLGYSGPCPPPGSKHRYFFKLYALDTDIDLDFGAEKTIVLKRIKGHVIAEGQLMGIFER